MKTLQKQSRWRLSKSGCRVPLPTLSLKRQLIPHERVFLRIHVAIGQTANLSKSNLCHAMAAWQPCPWRPCWRLQRAPRPCG